MGRAWFQVQEMKEMTAGPSSICGAVLCPSKGERTAQTLELRFTPGEGRRATGLHDPRCDSPLTLAGWPWASYSWYLLHLQVLSGRTGILVTPTWEGGPAMKE